MPIDFISSRKIRAIAANSGDVDRQPGLLIVGNRGGTNVGESLLAAAQGLMPADLAPAADATQGPRWLRHIAWRLDRRPLRMGAFGSKLTRRCDSAPAGVVLTTGIAPLNQNTLRELGERGIVRINYSTDDPWNPAHRARWFLRALQCYDFIFTTRQANVSDFKAYSGAVVSYLPFGFDPALFFPPPNPCDTDEPRSDIMFAGAADADRVPYISALVTAGFRLRLYGSYWNSFRATKNISRGQADAATLRRAIRSTKIALCLVRRANRDGSCMRTFEVPAVGACMLTEDTAEHRSIFGEENRTVVYFRTPEEMVEKARWLLDNTDERVRLAGAVHRLIVEGQHTYRDRLLTMLQSSRIPAEA